jgi:drug/metabolite transporter (DMT)-like permease|eukprot:Transcript_1462.p2 GENE.Transcript_1462~~Transcript_1462.p2  ORF type:complete len:287 (-),score=90.72 Transcript_1462:126-986(-)
MRSLKLSFFLSFTHQALVDTPAATVSFLGALIVVWNPLLEAFVDGRPKSFEDAPQTWLAAMLALAGVALLELAGADGVGEVGWGDAWAVLQAVGFGTSFFITEKMMAKEPSQALPITAAQCAVVAAICAVWAVGDGVSTGWILDESQRAAATLPGLLLEPSMRTVAAAAVWTGLITTAANRLGETTALGKMSSSEASVLLATEPLFAALFAAGLLGEALGWNDSAGGALIVGACLCNAASPEQVRSLLGLSPARADAEDSGAGVAEAVAAAVAEAKRSKVERREEE